MDGKKSSRKGILQRKDALMLSVLKLMRLHNLYSGVGSEMQYPTGG